jgi:deoxyribonuclease-1
MRFFILALSCIYSLSSFAISFNKGKKILRTKVYPIKGKTFYCNCEYNNKTIIPKGCGLELKKYNNRKYKLEWEHIVPAHAFGKSFHEWRNAKTICPQKKGKHSSARKCARKKNKLFKQMEGDVYNLVPSVGSVNALRSNYSFSEIDKTQLDVCSSGFKIANKKVMPPESKKGDVARIYFYMNSKYPGRGIISKKNIKLFKAWNKIDPVDNDECKLNYKKSLYQGHLNQFVMNYCHRKKNK